MAETTTRDPQEAYVGKDLGSREFVCTEQMRQHFFEGLKVDGAAYGDQSPYGRPVAPAMIVGDVDGGFRGHGFKNAFGNLWMRQEWNFSQGIFPDTAYHVTSEILDIYEWRTRTVVKQLVTMFDADGAPVVEGTHHQSYLLSQSEGKVALRDPKKKEGARKFAVPAGETIPSLDRTIDLEMCGIFFHGNKNYHTDKQASEELGFEEVVVGGKMTMSMIGTMMEQRFSKGFLEGGRLDLKFTNIVWPNDHVTAKGVITNHTDDADGRRAHASVWMEKDDGTVVVVGSAHALV